MLYVLLQVALAASSPLSLYSFTRWGVICYSKSQKHCQALLLLHTNSEQKKICQIFNFIVKLVSFFALAKFSAGTRFIPKSFIELEEFCSNRAYLLGNHYKKDWISSHWRLPLNNIIKVVVWKHLLRLCCFHIFFHFIRSWCLFFTIGLWGWQSLLVA